MMNFEKMFHEIFNHDIMEIFNDFAFENINLEKYYNNENSAIYNYSFKYKNDIIYADIMINFENDNIYYILFKNDKNNTIYQSDDAKFNNYQNYNNFLFNFYDKINDNIFINY